jgi:hypothetical protein
VYEELEPGQLKHAVSEGMSTQAQQGPGPEIR